MPNEIVAKSNASFAELRAKFTAPGAVRNVTLRFGSELRGNLRIGSFMLPGSISEAELGELAETAEITDPPGEKACLMASAVVVGAYRLDLYADPVSFSRSLIQVLQSYPAYVSDELANLRNPSNLVRKAKFPPSLAEVCEWADNLVAARKSAGAAARALIRSAERFAMVKASAGENLSLEYEADKFPTVEEYEAAEARQKLIFEREVVECGKSLGAGSDVSKYTSEVVSETLGRWARSGDV